MNSLYIVGVPAGDPDDLTRRALRILREAHLVVADDMNAADRLMAHHEITTPLAAARGDAPTVALATGDVAYLCPGGSLGLPRSGYELVRAAIEGDYPVVPIPGPALPVTALVLSGLPADSFVYLGGLPQQRATRLDLLASLTGERRTLVVAEQPERLQTVLADLQAILGDRPLVLMTASEEGTAPEWSPGVTRDASGVLWRGTLGEVPLEDLGLRLEPSVLPEPGRASGVSQARSCAGVVLVIGGAREQMTYWDETRLRAEIGASLAQGLGVRETSRHLAGESGWPRREVYRLAVDMARGQKP